MKFAVLVVLAVLFAAPSIAEQAWKPLGQPITAALDVDAQGHVTHTQLVGNNTLPALQTLAAQTTRNWKFVPATVDGKVAPSRTYASLAAEAREVNGSEQLRLHYLSHGPGRTFMQMPAYPSEMVRQDIEAVVTVDASVDANGALSDVHIVNAKTTHAAKGELFYRAVTDAFKKDRYLPELVDGRPVTTHIRTPVTFCLGDKTCNVRHLDHAMDAPHGAVDDTKSETSSFADIPVALDSPLKLISTQP